MREFQAHCYRGLGTRYATAGQTAQARAALTRAIDLSRAMAISLWLPAGEAALGRVA
jgi:hypothetical protein